MTDVDVDVALAAAAAGAAVVRAAYGTAVVKHPKARLDFATATDLEAERAILRVITDARPADAIEGEESGASGNASSDAGGSSTRCAARSTSPRAHR